MISKLLKNTYKIIVLGSVVLLQLKWRYLTLRKFSPYYESQMKNVTKYKSFSFVTDMRNSPFSPLQTIFSWEPALWTLMSVAWVWWMMMSKKLIVIFTFKQRLLSIDMKNKVVQHVKNEWMREWESEFRVFQVFQKIPGFCLTFRHFLPPHPHPCHWH